ncbi:hypothetical protein cyc_04007 [Cyclospora cayetanensis]|uniref:Uncharacterized protein n=1 Tax=Cyclospora cayetanensis TaxID=88456 RepID=A0A1D3CRD4_9EIME|nr:hypothetical protein cyc_04007 [Cyclospora cayetanensis]
MRAHRRLVHHQLWQLPQYHHGQQPSVLPDRRHPGLQQEQLLPEQQPIFQQLLQRRNRRQQRLQLGHSLQQQPHFGKERRSSLHEQQLQQARPQHEHQQAHQRALKDQMVAFSGIERMLRAVSSLSSRTPRVATDKIIGFCRRRAAKVTPYEILIHVLYYSVRGLRSKVRFTKASAEHAAHAALVHHAEEEPVQPLQEFFGNLESYKAGVSKASGWLVSTERSSLAAVIAAATSAEGSAGRMRAAAGCALARLAGRRPPSSLGRKAVAFRAWMLAPGRGIHEPAAKAEAAVTPAEAVYTTPRTTTVDTAAAVLEPPLHSLRVHPSVADAPASPAPPAIRGKAMPTRETLLLDVVVGKVFLEERMGRLKKALNLVLCHALRLPFYPRALAGRRPTPSSGCIASNCDCMRKRPQGRLLARDVFNERERECDAEDATCTKGLRVRRLQKRPQAKQSALKRLVLLGAHKQQIRRICVNQRTAHGNAYRAKEMGFPSFAFPRKSGGALQTSPIVHLWWLDGL